MHKMIAIVISVCFFLLVAAHGYSAPLVTGQPITVQHLGKLEWPQDGPSIIPALTQLVANDVNDLHGNLTCDLIISTPGNYHMALKDALYGRPDLGHIGLLQQPGMDRHLKVSICWSTSPSIAIEQLTSRRLQFKNITLVGRPALVMATADVMNMLIADGQVDGYSSQPLLSSRGNVILIRADKARVIHSVCDLGGSIRVVTPHPNLESSSFDNFSSTLFEVANQNAFGCNATDLFNSIFSQNLAAFDLSGFKNPYDIGGVLSAFGRGPAPQGAGAKWVASSRIMHRDIPYALCHDEADAGIIFYHLAVYLKQTLAATGCYLEIVSLGGTVENPQPLPGNKVASLFIAKVNGHYARKVNYMRNIIYNFFTTNPVWRRILIDRGMAR